jgi:D-3-phosphoglycerate dehydrogenase
MPSKPDQRFVVFVPEPFPEASLRVLDARYEVRQGRAGAAYSEAEMMKCLLDVDAIAITSRDPMTARIIASAPRLRVIAKAGSKPTSSVDMAAAERRGVRVTWTPGANVVSVAEMTLAMMLTVAKRLPEASSHLQAGGWRSHDFLGFELAGKTLGLVGLGAIGLAVASRFQAFGGRVVGFDPRVDTALAATHGIEWMPLQALYRVADIVSLHGELNAKTASMIDAAAFASMKTGAIFINTARGGLVDEDALLRALNEHRLAGAAIDVMREEPPRAGHPLVSHPRVFATPHVAAYTHEAQARECGWSLEDAGRILAGLEPMHSGPS